MNGLFQLRSLGMAALLCVSLTLTSNHAWGQVSTDVQKMLGLDNASTAAPKPAADGLPAATDIKFTTRLDHTAVWVGDQFHYFIIVDYPAAYEFVLDNLTKETVNMDPFTVVDVGQSLVQTNTGSKLTVDLTLANFATGQTSMQLPQFTLFYFRKANRTGGADQSDAESLTIPGPFIGVRSTLPPAPTIFRDTTALESWDRNRWVLPIVGWACLGFLIIGSGRELTLFIKKMKARKGPDRRKAMEIVRVRWTKGVPSDFTDPKTCQTFYDHSYQNLKEYIGAYLETPTMGLTADEMRNEMQRLEAKPDLTQKVTKILETCETLRYTQDGVTANTEAARGVAQDMREILSTKR